MGNLKKFFFLRHLIRVLCSSSTTTMNCSQIFLPLLLCMVILAPPLINAKECHSAGQCSHELASYHNELHMTFDTKTCADGFCYSFSCLDKNDMVTRGVGCYEDFFNACKWVDPDSKEIGKGKNMYDEENFKMFSCKDGGPDCAWRGIRKHEWGDGNAPRFERYAKGRTPLESDKNNKCDYDAAAKPRKDKVQCLRGGMCLTGAKEKNFSPQSNVTCDACAYFACTNDNKEIMLGWGCLSDFEKVCAKVPEDAKKKIRAKKHDYFYYDENAAVASCTSGDQCHANAFDEYSENKKYMNATYMKNFDGTYKGTCEYTLPPMDANTENGANEGQDGENGGTSNGEKGGKNGDNKKKPEENGANGIKICGIILLGLLFLHLW